MQAIRTWSDEWKRWQVRRDGKGDCDESKCRHARRSHLEGSFDAMRPGSVDGEQGSSTSTLFSSSTAPLGDRRPRNSSSPRTRVFTPRVEQCRSVILACCLWERTASNLKTARQYMFHVPISGKTVDYPALVQGSGCDWIAPRRLGR